jgi:hypothetical protein
MMMMVVSMMMVVPIVVTLVGIVTDVKSMHLKNVYSSNHNGRISINYNRHDNKYMKL